MNKSYIRKKILNLRKKQHFNNPIDAKKVIRLIKKNSIKSKKVGVYYPSNNEVSTINLIKLLIKKNFSVSLPVVKKKSQLSFYSWNFLDFDQIFLLCFLQKNGFLHFSQQSEFWTIGNCRGNFSKNPDSLSTF